MTAASGAATVDRIGGSAHRWWNVGAIVARSHLRGSMVPLLVAGLVLMSWAAVTTGLATAVSRTERSVDRFGTQTALSDVSFASEADFDGHGLATLVDQADGVVDTDVLWYAPTGIAFDDGVFVAVVGSFGGHWGRTFDRPVVLRGRVADPQRADEVMMSRSVAALLSAEVGDRLTLPTWDRTDWLDWFARRGPYPAFAGPPIEVQVTAIVVDRTEFAPFAEQTPSMLVTPAFVQRWSDHIGENGRSVVARLSADAGPPAEMAQRLTARAGRTVTATTVDDDVVDSLRGASRSISLALWVALAVTLVVGGAVTIVALDRRIRALADAIEPLRPLGATDGLVRAIATGPVAIVGLAGLLGGVAVVWWWSPGLTPGVAGRLDPLSGRAVDPRSVMIGVASVTAALAIASYLGSRRPTDRPARAPARFGRLADALGPTARVARRHVLATDRDRRFALALGLLVVALVATTGFRRQLSATASDPTRWGTTWSAEPELGFPVADYDAAIAATVADPDVSSVAEIVDADIVSSQGSLSVRTIDPRAGAAAPPVVLAGRLPQRRWELALGSSTADRFGLGVGDSIDLLTNFSGLEEFSVTGLIVPPTVPDSGIPGSGALVTSEAFADLYKSADARARVVLTYEPGASIQAVEKRLGAGPGWLFLRSSRPNPPNGVARMVSVDPVIRVLELVLIGCLIAAPLTSVAHERRRRRRETGILRSLGFTPRQVITSQVFAAAATGIVIAVPSGGLGQRIGAAAWRLSTRRLGLGPVHPSAGGLVGAGIIATVAALTAAAGAVGFGLIRSSVRAVLDERSGEPGGSSR